MKKATLAEVTVGTKAIYLFGSITYDTVFRGGLTTNFRFYVGGDMRWDEPGEMNTDTDGNDAT